MKIVTLSNAPLDLRFGSGGVALRFTEQLRVAGHEVDLFGPEHFQGARKSSRLVKFRQAFGALRLWRRLNLSRCDLAEFYGDEFWLVAALLRVGTKRPLIVAHTNGFEVAELRARRIWYPEAFGGFATVKYWLHRALSEIHWRAADVVVTLCEADERAVRECFPGKHVVTVPPGISREFLDVSVDGPRRSAMAVLGSWIPRKNVKAIVAAAKIVMDRHPDVTFEVFGSGKSPESIHSLFPVGLQRRITVHPSMPEADLARELSTIAVFLFPSYYEGFGLALAEALASGCACVTTRTGLGAELLDGVEALLVSSHDVEAMARAVSQLLMNQELRNDLGAAGRKRVADLSWDRGTANLVRCYEDLTQRRIQRR